MLLNDVVMGKAIKLKTTDQSLTQVRRCIPRNISFRISKIQPPPGYDAVIGEPGGDLNYDECIGECKKLIAWLHMLIPG